MKKTLLSLLIISAFAQTTFAQAGAPEGTTNPAPADTPRTTSRDTTGFRSLSPGGFLLEPMILATREDETIKTSQLPIVTDDTSGSSTGYGLGLRFGGHVSEVFFLGLDARYARARLSDSFYQTADANIYNLAPVVGVQTPYFGIRLLAGYVVAGENDPASGYRGLDLKFKEANGWRVGAGLYIAAVSLNLEYQDLTYNTTEIQSFGAYTVNNATSVDANNRGYALSVSFPVEM